MDVDDLVTKLYAKEVTQVQHFLVSHNFSYSALDCHLHLDCTIALYLNCLVDDLLEMPMDLVIVLVKLVMDLVKVFWLMATMEYVLLIYDDLVHQ